MSLRKTLTLIFNPRALIEAVAENPNITANEVEDWLISGAAPNIQGLCGVTALHLAVANSASLEVIQVLLDAHADPNIQDINNNTALILAILQGAFNVAKVLLNSRAADPNIRGQHNKPALAFAVEKGAPDDVITALHKAGADTDLIQDPRIRQEAVELFDKNRLRCMEEVFLPYYGKKMASDLKNAKIPEVIGTFLDIKPEKSKFRL
jgi:ankyrin repeat protein